MGGGLHVSARERGLQPYSFENSSSCRVMNPRTTRESVGKCPLLYRGHLNILSPAWIFKIYYPAWLRAKYNAIWEFRHTERVLFGIRLPSPAPQFYGPGMEIGEYTRDARDGRPKILKFLMS